MMTADDFKVLTGRDPELGDLDRVNCKHAGERGHYYCGICSEHNLPRFMCGIKNHGLNHSNENAPLAVGESGGSL